MSPGIGSDLTVFAISPGIGSYLTVFAMSPGIGSYLTVFAVAAGVTLVITPVVRRISERWDFMVEPDARRIHERSTALLGGVAMFTGFLSAMGVAWLLDDFDVVFAAASEAVGIVIAGLVMIAFGTYDDVREMSAPAKVASMVLAGSILSFTGVTVLNLRLPVVGALILSQDLAFLITVLWLVAIVNAINLIDGLDGLAAGIVAIAGITFFVYSVKLTDDEVLLPNNIGPLVAITAGGVAVGFLPHNFHRARIFMGDGGALFLGTLLAASTVSVGGRSSEPFAGQTYFLFAPHAHPADHPGSAGSGCAVGGAPANPGPDQPHHPRQGAPAPSIDEPGPRAPPQRADPVAVHRPDVHPGAVPHLRRRGRSNRGAGSRGAGADALHGVPPHPAPPHPMIGDQPAPTRRNMVRSSWLFMIRGGS